ncbi:MAG TPA: rubredoxin [Negativicutes bacterium]|nr:rubredoxin [Negativicutes bacterium]
MAVWKCEKCGYEKEGRCKPKKCPSCEGQQFVKKE